MFVTYRPEGGEEQTWEFDPDRVRSVEAELIEKRFGQEWEQFKAAIQQGSVRARRVLLWHLTRRTHHTLKYEDTPDFYTGELLVEYSVAELTAMRDTIVKIDDPDKLEQRDAILTALDIELTDAMAREGEPAGKARSGRSASDTGSPLLRSPDSDPESKKNN